MKKTTALSLVIGSSLHLLGQEKPNIIVLYIDDMGYSDASCYGGKFTPTPNIDKIAAEGVRFTQYYTACPISSPSRVAITTGMYPTRWGITTYLNTRAINKANESNDFLDKRAPSVARILKENGYATGHFGKWHIGGGRDVDNAPPFSSYGFDEYTSTWESPDPDPELTAKNSVWSSADNVKRWNRSSYFVDKTLDFLKRKKDSQPCYINLWPDDVHLPWVLNDGGFSSVDTEWQSPANLTEVLRLLDIQIGRLMDGLKELGIDNNTLVLFSSDNGPEPNFTITRTGAMRGKKGTLYEGGIRLPFIARWPNHIAPNQVNTESVLCSVDILPTLCKITGAKIPTEFSIDGEDRTNVIIGGTNTNRTNPLYWEFGKNLANRVSPHIAVRDGDWKLLVNADGSNVELYNLKTDLFEKLNVASTNVTLANDLKTKAIDWYNKNYLEFANLPPYNAQCRIESSGTTLSGLKQSWGQSFVAPCNDPITDMSFNAATSVNSSFTFTIRDGADCNATVLHTQMMEKIIDGVNIVHLSMPVSVVAGNTYYFSVENNGSSTWKVRYSNTTTVAGNLKTHQPTSPKSACDLDWPNYDMSFSMNAEPLFTKLSNNPLIDKCNITYFNKTLHISLQNEVTEVQLFDCTGRIVVNQKVSNGSMPLDLRQGFYIVAVKIEGEMHTKKIII